MRNTAYIVGVGVNPTHVGMDRTRWTKSRQWTGKPHARGDGPEMCDAYGVLDPRKPHARGDGPYNEDLTYATYPVNPTHVGMDRLSALCLVISDP